MPYPLILAYTFDVWQLFGKDSEYNFGKIFAAPRDADAKEEERTYATVSPLAEHLDLEIDITWSVRSISECLDSGADDRPDL